jgi:flagellin-like protein
LEWGSISNLIYFSKKQNSNKFHKRAVAPVIATLLLVAIAVVGGSIAFVFAQDVISETQISGNIQPEYIKILGYDARDVKQLKAHDGEKILPNNCCGITDGIKNYDERIAVYLQNNSVQMITISELRLGGEVYQYTSSSKLGNWNGGTSPQPKEYVIMDGHDGKSDGDILQISSPQIQPGQIVTVVIDLDKSIQTGRDMQAKISTTNGNVFVSTLIVGQNSG